MITTVMTEYVAPPGCWWPIVGGGAHPRDAPGVQADVTAQMAAAGRGRPLPVCRQAGSSRPYGTRGKSEQAQARITKHTRHSNTTFTRYESVPRRRLGATDELATGVIRVASSLPRDR